jgi:hypothetical protein
MNKTTRGLARAAGPAAVLTGVAAVAVAALPGTASAAPVCYGAERVHVVTTKTYARITCRFGYQDEEQWFMVPGGVFHARVDLIGGWGGWGTGSAEDNGWGAPPQEVSGTIPVQPRSILYVEVGGNGHDGSGNTGGQGGWNGGGTGGGSHGGGGGGGGASDIRTISMNDTAHTLASRLIVAGGGGGGGAAGNCAVNGGHAGVPPYLGPSDGGGCSANAHTEGGGQAAADGFDGGGSGGGGTDGSSSGTGGSYGTAGQSGAGGNGGSSGGGAGGSGLLGGGGGGGSANTSNDLTYGGGGGGGTGSSGSTNPLVRWTWLGPTGLEPAVSLTIEQPLSHPRPGHGRSLTTPATAADKSGPHLTGRLP